MARWLLPVSWLAAAVGYYGPWIEHETAALTISGADLAEFVKFLPAVRAGSLQLARQAFYLPAVAITVSIALLVGSRTVRWPALVRAALLILTLPVSLQLLPPAWSPNSLLSAEFRAQTAALCTCWLLLATFWLWGKLAQCVTGLLAAGLALAAAGMACWQFLAARPAIGRVYAAQPPAGWGFWLCLAGLVGMAVASLSLACRARSRGRHVRRAACLPPRSTEQ